MKNGAEKLINRATGYNPLPIVRLRVERAKHRPDPINAGDVEPAWKERRRDYLRRTGRDELIRKEGLA